jgi:hypothetical protein
MVLNAPPKPQSEQSNPSEITSPQSVPHAHHEADPLIERGTLQAVKPQELAGAALEKLHSIFVPDHLEGPAKMLYRPILLAAIGIHALVLFPGGKPAEKAPDKKEKPVTITQVATGKKAPAKLPTTKITPAKPALPKLNNANSTAPAVKPSPKPEAAKPEAAKPETPTPSTPQELPKVSPMPPGGANAGDPFADFVHHPAARPGCYESSICYKVAGNAIAAVADTFNSSLKAKGFTTSDAGSESGRQVIEVSKGGKTNFLTLFQDGADTVYVLAPTPINSLDDLKNAMTLPSGFIDLMTAIPEPPGSSDGSASSIPDETTFTDPSKYFAGDDEFLPIIDGSPKIFSGLEPENVFKEHFEPQLKSVFPQGIELAGEYGGGKLYRMKTAKGAFYLNIVPHAKSPTDSIVVVFNSQP